MPATMRLVPVKFFGTRSGSGPLTLGQRNVLLWAEDQTVFGAVQWQTFNLAPGRSPIDALPRLARAASKRIAEGALNGSTITALAQQLGVSPRHLRRAVEREFGVPPRALAEANRLASARHLLVETTMPVIQVAYASGFQSVRRFNAAFRACYRASPTTVRRARSA